MQRESSPTSDLRSSPLPSDGYAAALSEPSLREITRSRRRRDLVLFFITLAAIASSAFAAVLIFKHAYTGIDDADISIVYAKHLAGGHGFVYNVGDERVEGFTSFFHVLIGAGVFGLLPAPELFLIGLSVLYVTLAVFLLAKSLDSLLAVDTASKTSFRPLHLIVIAWVICSPAFVFWTTVSLMETALWCFLLSAAVSLVVFELVGESWRTVRLAGIATLAVLLPLTRPEGFALAPVVIFAYVVARRFTSSTWRSVLPGVIVPGALWAMTVAGITAFRLVYFGFPLPNTYYAKVSPNTLRNLSDGVGYLARFLVEQPLVILVAVAATAGLAVNVRFVVKILASGRCDGPELRSRRIGVAWFIVSLVALAGLLIPVYGGGDHLEGFRFYQPVWPIFVLPVILLGCRVLGGVGHPNIGRAPVRRWAAALATVPVLLAAAEVPWPRQPQAALLDQLVIAEDGRRLGAALNRLFPLAQPAVGVTAAGGVKVTYRGAVFDLLGLNHVAMGHSPGERLGYKNHAAFNKAVFWSEPPSVVLPILCPGPVESRLAGAEFETLSDGILKGLFRDERFQRRYMLVTVRGNRDQTLLDGDPFFFVPSPLPRPPAEPSAYRDATLIGYVDAEVAGRLRAQGWNVSVLPRSRDAASMRQRPSPNQSACAPAAS